MTKHAANLLLLLSIPVVGCGGVRFEHDPISYSSPAAARWVSPLEKPPFATAQKNPLRANAVAFAEKRAHSETSVLDFGCRDIADLFAALGKRVDWDASQPLSNLIRAAERRGAYDARRMPRPGDIVLFHNQTDRNGNHIADDWLTGCGIVLSREADTFRALTRTEHGPRIATVTPKIPSVRTRDGRILNSYVRVPGPNDPPNAEYLSGQLFAGAIDIVKLLNR